MAGRMTVLVVFAILGFVGGIVAKLVYSPLSAWILQMWPNFGLDWILSGAAGTVLTLLIVVVWASFSPDK
jgi:predicted lysophospholipase L1 biosynthesis ABC-type transport system permease subunit